MDTAVYGNIESRRRAKRTAASQRSASEGQTRGIDNNMHEATIPSHVRNTRRG